ncbi:hypothetical protein, partial [Thiolapillus sp.]|uniref:hypothetical protein n=1 Tax=Thiolapillus sp. TaxID=2017437 RepID=UPI003AF8630B
MTRTAGAQIGCQRPSRFWGLGCPKIYHEAEDTLAGYDSFHSYLNEQVQGKHNSYIRRHNRMNKKELIEAIAAAA